MATGPIHYLNPGDQASLNPRYFQNNPPSGMPITRMPAGFNTTTNGGGGYGLPPVDDPAAQQAYNDYIRRLSQQWQNEYSAIQNQIAQQRMANDLANLGLNFAGDTINQNLALGRQQENIASLQAQQMRQGQQNQLDLARSRFNTQQNRLNMQDDLARQQAQMQQQEITPGYEMAKRLLGARY